MNKELKGMLLLEKLCSAFGPSGCEDPCMNMILEIIDGCYDELLENRTLGLIAVVRGGAKDKEALFGVRRLMLSCHMDEVGFMIKKINEDGTLSPASICGPDTRIMASRRLLIGDGDRLVSGVFGVKPIHLLKADERDSAIPFDDMYIDIGAESREEAEKLVKVGDFATFQSDFVLFGENAEKIKAKAIDDRAGCAIMCDMIRELYPIKDSLPFDIYFAFTRCEEVGISGARGAAHLIDPDHALIFESTAISDSAGTPPHATVAKQGEGPAISLMDRSTIYDKEFTKFLLELGKEKDIPCQIKKYISGGNDAGHIHKSRAGVKCAVMSIPSRYIHTPSNVISKKDFESTYRLGLEGVKTLARIQ